MHRTDTCRTFPARASRSIPNEKIAPGHDSLARRRTPNSRAANHSRRGTVLVEFALTIPLVFLFVFAALEFSRFNMLRHSVAQAAYEGARRGIVPGATADDVRAAALAVCDIVGGREAYVAVSPPVITPTTPSLNVTVTMPLNRNGWVVPRFIDAESLTQSITMAREQFDTSSVP